jgi:pimeloyl-ACP methyl ester carboxylesterase
MLKALYFLILAAVVGVALQLEGEAVEARSNIVWRDCYDGFECGRMQVPLDHSRPRSGDIEIALIRAPALDQSNKLGSLLVNFGGPGGPGVEGVLNSVSFFPQELQDHFDIIGFDPRGVGQSSAVDCVDDFSEFPLLDSTPGPRAYSQQIEFWREFARDCQRRSSSLIQFVNTESAARDMDLIRAELGDEKLTYIGFSYGTLLGSAYAELFPDRIRAIVLDGVLDPANDARELIVGGGIATDIAFNAFLDACRANASCALKSPDLAATFDQVVAAAEEEPLPGWSFPIRADDILGATFSSMYNSSSWSTLAEAIRQAYEERSGVGFGVLISGAQPPDDVDIDFTNGLEAFSAIACVDLLAIDGEDEFNRIADAAAAASPRFGRHLAYALALPCAFWPGADRRAIGPVNAPGAPPILVVSSRFDPATPYTWGVSVASQLESAVLLTYDGYGHISSGDCASSAVVAYLVDLLPPPDATSCPNLEAPFPPIDPLPSTDPPIADVDVAPTEPSRPSGTITPPDTGSDAPGASSGLGFVIAGLLLVGAGAAIGAASRRWA